MLELSESLALEHIAAAVADGVNAQPEFAAGALIERLTANFGPLVEKVVGLIKSGLTNLPAIIAALEANGVTLPAWASVVIQILLAVVA